MCRVELIIDGYSSPCYVCTRESERSHVVSYLPGGERVDRHQGLHTLYRCRRPSRRVRQPQWGIRMHWWAWWYWGVVVVLITTGTGGEDQERLGVDPLGRSGPPPL